MTQHTQGEWEAVRSAGKMQIWGGIKARHVCEINNDDTEDQANARLIAAAPKLLEALHYALKQIGDCAPELINTQKVIRAAIAAAKGE